VSESSESTGGPNEKLEVLSASNRFNFELLADYNSAAPMEGKAEKKSEKPQAAGERAGQKTPKPQPQPIVHPIPNSVTPGASRGQFAPSGPQRFRPNGNPVPVPIPNTGGPR
jgi:hypothetical protein